jgi:hypothetical protein
MNDRNRDTFQEFLPALVNWVRRLFLGRDQTGGYFRLGLCIVLFSMYWVIVVVVTGFPGEVPISYLQTFPPLTYPFLNVASTFFNPEVILHLLPVLGMLFWGLFLTSIYLTDLYELDSFWTGFRYLISTLFGLSYPRLIINQGDLELLDPYNPIRAIGGPGIVRINLGFAAVFESQDGVPRVYGSTIEAASATNERDGRADRRSTFSLSGFERIRDVIDLRDRIGKVDEIRTLTRDGIEVYARDAQMVFRVHGGDRERNLENPYPYSDEGVRRLVYGQAVDEHGAHSWEVLLTNLVRNEIVEFVSQYTFEEFLALQPRQGSVQPGQDEPERAHPPGKHEVFHIPRRKLTNRFHTSELKSRLELMGLEMDWVGVGTWEIRDPAFDEKSDDIGPGQTIMATWRDLQRAQLYQSRDYLERQRVGRFRDRTAEALEEILYTWRSGKLGGEHRCYELMARVRDLLASSAEQLSRDPNHELPPDAKLVIEHFDRLIKPKTFGEPR